jgi:hypothetical protein
LFPSQITLKIKKKVEFTPSFVCRSKSTEKERTLQEVKKSFDPKTGQDDRISKAEALLHLQIGTEVQNKDKEKMHHREGTRGSGNEASRGHPAND